MFTFITLTYNHNEYIIEHLESIRYQIENYGKGMQFKLILSDDNSKDNTIDLVEDWIRKNPTLFKSIEVLKNKKNIGVVANYLQATSYLDNEPYKLLAGDDLYYKNNIFEIIEILNEYDIVFTSVIDFDNFLVENSHHLNWLLSCKNTNKIKRMLSYENIFNAPGTFYNNKVIQNIELREFISKYNWIEDFPSMFYLFNNTNPKYYVLKKPYIMYRNSVGISSNNEKNEKKNQYLIEIELMRKDMKMKLYKYPKYLNFYYYYRKIEYIKMEYFDSKINKEIKEYNLILEDEMNKAPAFLKMIKSIEK